MNARTIAMLRENHGALGARAWGYVGEQAGFRRRGMGASGSQTAGGNIFDTVDTSSSTSTASASQYQNFTPTITVEAGGSGSSAPNPTYIAIGGLAAFLGLAALAAWASSKPTRSNPRPRARFVRVRR